MVSLPTFGKLKMVDETKVGGSLQTLGATDVAAKAVELPAPVESFSDTAPTEAGAEPPAESSPFMVKST